MQRKQNFINDKRRRSYLFAVYNRIYRGQSVLIEGEYGVGKTRFLELLNPKNSIGHGDPLDRNKSLDAI